MFTRVGSMKRASRIGCVAVVGVMSGTWGTFSHAADLGGDCCADLEERVAELEATTVRKGNRKVSLELSGQVNKALLAWNDGRTSDAFVTDSNYSSTRLKFKGTGRMAPGWKAGFFIEYEFRDSSTNLVDQTNADNRGLENALRIRQEHVFVEGEKFGRVTIGQQSPATKDIARIGLGGAISDSEIVVGTAFRVRDSQFGVNTALATGIIGSSTRLSWGSLGSALDQQLYQAVRYDTPSIYGFIVSASWGENDFWDIAVRYQKEWNSIRVTGGIGYSYTGDPVRQPGTQQGFNDTGANSGRDQVFVNANLPATGPNTKSEVVSGSLSAMHVPTGIFATFAAATRSYDGLVPGGRAFDKDASYFYVQSGITKRFFDVGATTFYGEYANYNNFAAGVGYIGAPTVGSAAGRVVSSEFNRYGGGFTQAFDGAALELYANYYHFSADIDFRNTGNTATLSARPEDFDAVLTGARLKF